MRTWNKERSKATPCTWRFSAYLWGIETQFDGMRATWYCVFSAYLWGIETRNSYRSMVKHPVFSLPMRNWNNLITMTMWLSGKFSAYLWGIETGIFWAILRQQIRFSAYLWGIETMKVARWQTWLKPFSAYLWGIETKMLRVIRKKLDGFQPTYEELKPVLPLLCFKLCPRFQPTYEELKLGGQQDRQPEQNVFSLPMRNWNIFTGIKPTPR